MHLFYTPGVSGNPIQLDETESGHAVKVLRLRVGDPVVVVDGEGGWHEGTIADPHHKRCMVQVDRSVMNFEKRNYEVHIAVAPTKNSDRLEWFLEKATEIGIDRLVPLHCTHSERKNVNTERLKKVAISAMKQSLKAWLPEVSELTKFETLIREPFEGKKFIAHCYPGEKVHLKDALQPHDKALVLIGPEGDFSPEEVELAMATGFIPVTLGDARLRTETAALVAVMTAALVCASCRRPEAQTASWI